MPRGRDYVARLTRQSFSYAILLNNNQHSIADSNTSIWIINQNYINIHMNSFSQNYPYCHLPKLPILSPTKISTFRLRIGRHRWLGITQFVWMCILCILHNLVETSCVAILCLFRFSSCLVLVSLQAQYDVYTEHCSWCVDIGVPSRCPRNTVRR